MTPSRQFLIQQAILNAAAKCMPATVKADGVSRALFWLTYQMDGCLHPGQQFVTAIHSEFHILAQQYEVAA